MRAFGCAAVMAIVLSRPVLAAPEPAATVADCLTAAAQTYRESPAVLMILLTVEGGSLGRISRNGNGSVDIGPMQVNSVWLPRLAGHWRATVGSTYRALRDNFCANVEAGAWILRLGLDEARGDLWQGVAFYHSHDPARKADYLRKVLQAALALQARAAARREPG